ncbi:MAG: stage V sporulation protein AB [Gallintestinimicrobium sp.]
MVVFGTLVGCLASVFPGAVIFGREWLQKRLEAGAAFECLVLTAEALTGLFAGIFVGCLALAIAEMLDSIPILTRRIGFRHGLGLMVISIAMGKAVGSLLYFWHPIFR